MHILLDSLAKAFCFRSGFDKTDECSTVAVLAVNALAPTGTLALAVNALASTVNVLTATLALAANAFVDAPQSRRFAFYTCRAYALHVRAAHQVT